MEGFFGKRRSRAEKASIGMRRSIPPSGRSRRFKEFGGYEGFLHFANEAKFLPDRIPGAVFREGSRA